MGKSLDSIKIFDSLNNGNFCSFAMFNQVRIPRENLLSRYGDVSPDGKFLTKIKDYRKRMAVSFGSLSGGRVNICGTSSVYLTQAVTIAVRYSASRKQFGPDNSSEEYSVLEYQSHQYRVLPHLATAIAFKVFTQWLCLSLNQMLIKQIMGEQNLNAIVMEMHALSSAAKPHCTWAVQQAIQDCREACGGHGYLKGSFRLSLLLIVLALRCSKLPILQSPGSVTFATITM